VDTELPARGGGVKKDPTSPGKVVARNVLEKVVFCVPGALPQWVSAAPLAHPCGDD
jgi:hypothetical protein